MKRTICDAAIVALLLLAGCGRHASTVAAAAATAGNKNVGTSDYGSNESQPGRLRCGDVTYRLISESIDSEINEACELMKKSYQAALSNHSARVRFSCQDSKGHFVSNMLVQDNLLDDYNRSCQQFVAAEAALPNSPTDRQPYFNALRKFQAETNQLTRQSVDAANAIWRENRADKAALNQLVKVRGGSIEIAN